MMTVTRKREGGVEPNLGKKRRSQTLEKKTLHRLGFRHTGEHRDNGKEDGNYYMIHGEPLKDLHLSKT